MFRTFQATQLHDSGSFAWALPRRETLARLARKNRSLQL
jgi:hypothetical protein